MKISDWTRNLKWDCKSSLMILLLRNVLPQISHWRWIRLTTFFLWWQNLFSVLSQLYYRRFTHRWESCKNWNKFLLNIFFNFSHHFLLKSLQSRLARSKNSLKFLGLVLWKRKFDFTIKFYEWLKGNQRKLFGEKSLSRKIHEIIFHLLSIAHLSALICRRLSFIVAVYFLTNRLRFSNWLISVYFCTKTFFSMEIKYEA